MPFNIKNMGSFFKVAVLCAVIPFAAHAQADSDFTPRWAQVIENYNGYYELSNQELMTVYGDIDRFNQIYDQQGDDVFDVAFYPDPRARRFYEITPYNDSYGNPIEKSDSIKKTIMELRYLLNGNSMIKLADDSTVNLFLNMIPRQDTNIIFARTSDTPFFKNVSKVCLISYDPNLDDDWSQRKAFFNETKPFASALKLYEDIPDDAWRNFMHHIRASMCIHPEIASWVIEPSGLALDIDKLTRKNKAFSFMMVYAAMASARDGYSVILPKITQFFKDVEEAGTPVFTMKLQVADLNPKSGKVRLDKKIAYPFTPSDIITKASTLDYMSYATARELADALFQIVVAAELDSQEINNKWITEEFESFRMGF